MKFDFVFNDPWFVRMRAMEMEPGYSKLRAWRSDDLGQTYRVTVAEDSVRQLTVVIMSRKDEHQLSYDEKLMILDMFYPNRYGHREEGAGSSYLSKFSVWPHESDYELLWYVKQLESYHPEP